MGRQGSTPLRFYLIEHGTVGCDFRRELVQPFKGFAGINHGPRVVPVLIG